MKSIKSIWNRIEITCLSLDCPERKSACCRADSVAVEDKEMGLDILPVKIAGKRMCYN